MFPKRKRLLFFLCILGIQLSVSRIAEAEAELSLSDGVVSVPVIDNGVGDTNPTLGAITFVGAVGNFSGTFNVGTSKPFVGSALQPQLGLLSSWVTTGDQGGTLTMLFGDNGFGPVTNGTVSAHIDGTTGGEVSYLTFMDGSNLSLGVATSLTTQGPLGGAIFANAIGNTTFGLNTSLTTEIVITQGGHAVTEVNSVLRITSGALAAPEGGSAITLLAAALVAMEILRRRSRPQIS